MGLLFISPLITLISITNTAFENIICHYTGLGSRIDNQHAKFFCETIALRESNFSYCPIYLFGCVFLILTKESYEAINDRNFGAVIISLNIRSEGSWTRILGRQEVLLIYDFMKGPEVRLSKIERDREIRNSRIVRKLDWHDPRVKMYIL